MAKRNKSPMPIIMIITLVVIGLVTAIVIISNSQTTRSGTAYDEQPPIEAQPTIGEEDAAVQVVEFGDYKCPSCKQWGDQVYPQLISDYVESGDVNFSFINVLFHGQESYIASLASEAVYSQNPDVYWDFHKEIFNQQPTDHNATWVTVDKMVEIASGIDGIDAEQLRTDIEDEIHADQVNQDNQLVQDYGVELTPSIMVNDVMVEDPFDYEAISELIEEELEGN